MDSRYDFLYRDGSVGDISVFLMLYRQKKLYREATLSAYGVHEHMPVSNALK